MSSHLMAASQVPTHGHGPAHGVERADGDGVPKGLSAGAPGGRFDAVERHERRHEKVECQDGGQRQ